MPGAGAGAPDSLLELRACCWWRLRSGIAPWRIGMRAPARRADARPAAAAAGHQAQDELRLAELAGALDTQRQMNALLSHELRAPLATISAAAQSLDMILAGNGEAVDNRLARPPLGDAHDRTAGTAADTGPPRGTGADPARRSHRPGDDGARRPPPCAPIPRMPLVLDADGALPAYCDRSLTSVVLRNLIHNAVKYSPASEPIRIEAGAREHGDGVRQAWIAVVDRGPHRGRRPAANFRAASGARRIARHPTGRRALSGATHLRKPGRLATMTSRVGAGSRFVITLRRYHRPPLTRPADGSAQAANT